MFIVYLFYLTIGSMMHRTVSILFTTVGEGKEKSSLIFNCFYEGSTYGPEKSQVNEFLSSDLALYHSHSYSSASPSCHIL